MKSFILREAKKRPVFFEHHVSSGNYYVYGYEIDEYQIYFDSLSLSVCCHKYQDTESIHKYSNSGRKTLQWSMPLNDFIHKYGQLSRNLYNKQKDHTRTICEKLCANS